MMKNLNQNGQALIEALLALSAAAVTATVVTILVISALSNANYTRAQTAAAAYAKQGLEYARNLRDTNYANFKNSYQSGTWCLSDSSANSLSGPSASCPNNVQNNTFSRSLIFGVDGTKCDSGGSPTIYTQSVVSWTDSKCSTGVNCHNVTLYTCLATDNSLSP